MGNKGFMISKSEDFLLESFGNNGNSKGESPVKASCGGTYQGGGKTSRSSPTLDQLSYTFIKFSLHMRHECLLTFTKKNVIEVIPDIRQPFGSAQVSTARFSHFPANSANEERTFDFRVMKGL
jgi:hypothetical protein